MTLALDFDGVVADGFAECLLTAWNAWHGRSVADFSEASYAAVPEPFKARFRHLRSFVRHDGHFLVAFLAGSEAIRRSADFAFVYDGTEAALRDGFRADFARYRRAVQEERFELWVGQHRVNPNMLALLQEEPDIHIVSGKDAESIDLILRRHCVDLAASRIHGRLSDKRPVLRALAAEAMALGERMIFCDDNLDNVLEGLELGIDTVWALWGHHTLEHLERARAHDIVGMSPAGFAARVQASHACRHGGRAAATFAPADADAGLRPSAG